MIEREHVFGELFGNSFDRVCKVARPFMLEERDQTEPNWQASPVHDLPNEFTSRS